MNDLTKRNYVLDNKDNKNNYLRVHENLNDRIKQQKTFNSDTNRINRNTKISYILILLCSVILLEFLLRDHIEKLSEYFYLQKDSNYLENQAMTAPRCLLLKKLGFFEFQGKYLLVILIFNYSNIFAAFSFIFLDSIAVFLNGTLKLLYNQPRPFWRNEKFLPCFCSINFGAPSTTALDQFLLFVVLYKSLTYRKDTTKKMKICVGIFCLFFLISICLARILQSAHSINQIILGFTIGFSVYYIYFEILEVDFSKKNQFRYILENNSKIVYMAFLLFLLSLIFHEYIKMIFSGNAKLIQDKILWQTVFRKYCEIVEINLFDNETYFKSTVLFLFLGMQIGIYSEYELKFKGNFELFSKYFFEENQKNEELNQKSDEEIFENPIIISNRNLENDENNHIYCKEGNIYFHNRTNLFKMILRFLLMSLIYYILYKYIFIFGDVKTDSLLFLITFKYAFCNFLYGFIIFFVFPNISNLLKLTNNKLFYYNEENFNRNIYNNRLSILVNGNKEDNEEMYLKSNIKEGLLEKNDICTNSETDQVTILDQNLKRKISDLEISLSEKEIKESKEQ